MDKLKSPQTAFDNLCSILKSGQLRVGSYHEVIKLVVPVQKTYDLKTRKIKIEKNVPKTMATSAVCCLADIPITELFHHAKWYGKIGVGFSRKSVVKAGFNPVFYTLESKVIPLRFYNAQNALERAEYADISSELDNLQSNIESQVEDYNIDLDFDSNGIESEVEFIQDYAKDALKELEDAMAFIKTFREDEFDTIYSEREWRSVTMFEFNWKDVTDIILPKDGNFFELFNAKLVKALGVPKHVEISAWEDHHKE